MFVIVIVGVGIGHWLFGLVVRSEGDDAGGAIVLILQCYQYRQHSSSFTVGGNISIVREYLRGRARRFIEARKGRERGTETEYV